MTTTNVTITPNWTEAHGTAETIDVSCNSQSWYCIVSTAAPATSDIGRLLDGTKVYNIVLEGDENLYAKTESVVTNANLAIDN